MNQICQNVLEKIRDQKIKPRSKWYFLLKNYSIWGMFVFAVVVGSISFGIILFQIDNTQWDIHEHLAHDWHHVFFLMLPYFWFLIMLAFIAIAYLNFRSTSKGYRYNVFIIAGGSLLLSFVLGTSIYATGFSEKLESIFQDVPYYEDAHFLQWQVWMQPEKGLLAGQVMQVQDDHNFVLKDFYGEKWQILLDVDDEHPTVYLHRGMKLSLQGEQVDEYYFVAYKLRPWRRKRWFKDLIIKHIRIIPNSSLGQEKAVYNFEKSFFVSYRICDNQIRASFLILANFSN